MTTKYAVSLFTSLLAVDVLQMPNSIHMQEMLRYDNVASAWPVIDLASMGKCSTWRYNRPRMFYQCRMITLQYDRASQQIRYRKNVILNTKLLHFIRLTILAWKMSPNQLANLASLAALVNKESTLHLPKAHSMPSSKPRLLSYACLWEGPVKPCGQISKH